jgi:hypothetical protein
LAENSRRVISIGLPICMTLCEALQAAQNRGTVDGAVPAGRGASNATSHVPAGRSAETYI